MQNKDLIISISKRLLTSIFVVFIIISLIFVLTRLAPGDPSYKYISPSLSSKHIELVKQKFQLDEPLHIQYIYFIRNIFEGDLGISYNYKKPAFDVIFEALSFTIKFSTAVFIFQLIISFILAIISIKLAGSTLDKFITKVSLLVYSLPVFVSGLLLILLFSIIFDWLPMSGYYSLGSNDKSTFLILWDNFKHLILPVLTLSLSFIPVYFRYIRDNFESISNSAFIINLKANGVSDKVILLKHIIPNSINPLLAIAGIDIGVLLSGSLITEYIFGLPGMGRLTLEAIFSRDYPLIIGCSILSSVFMVIANIGMDALRTLLDKRNSEVIIS